MANIQKKGENHSFLTTNFVLLQKLNRNAVKYMKVYIIIPCYNEEAVIEETALQLTAVLDERFPMVKFALRAELYLSTMVQKTTHGPSIDSSTFFIEKRK